MMKWGWIILCLMSFAEGLYLFIENEHVVSGVLFLFSVLCLIACFSGNAHSPQNERARIGSNSEDHISQDMRHHASKPNSNKRGGSSGDKNDLISEVKE